MKTTIIFYGCRKHKLNFSQVSDHFVILDASYATHK